MLVWTNGQMIIFYVQVLSQTCEAVDLIPQGKRTPAIWWKFFEDPRFSPNLRFFGRTDLSISLSRAKFDEQADFEVCSGVAPPKPRQTSEKRIFRSEMFADFFFWRRKMKRQKSSEMRFGKVSRRSQPSLRRKRPFNGSKSLWRKNQKTETYR